MIKTYKILSLLLSYPNQDVMDFMAEIPENLSEEGILNTRQIDNIQKFIDAFKSDEIETWQEHYVQLFDYSRAVSLHLFEHVYGESKDRGQAMVDLISFYAEDGLEIKTSELPDYLPAFLEFLSMTKNESVASEVLSEIAHIISKIHDKLKGMDNPYQHLLEAVLSLSAREPDPKLVDSLNQMEKPVDLDKEYEEEPVRFGENNNCNIC